MWAAMERRRNSYLRKTFVRVDAGTLNRSVDSSFEAIKREFMNGEEKELLPDELPILAIDKRICEGYGVAGFKKLIQELSSRDVATQDAALNAVWNKLADSKLCRMAIDLQIVPKLGVVLLKEQAVRKAIETLSLVAGFESGAREIAADDQIMGKVLELLEQSSPLLAALSLHLPVLDQFLADGYLNRLKPVVSELSGQENPQFLKFLALLIERNPDDAVREGYFELLFGKLQTTDPVNMAPWLEYFGYLLSTPLVQKQVTLNFVIHFLYHLLDDRKLSGPGTRFAVLAFQNCTIGSKAKHFCSELWRLPRLLIELAHNKQDDYLQLYAINTLKHLAEYPRTRMYINKTWRRQIDKIYCMTEESLAAKRKLFAVMGSGCAYLYKH